MACTMTDNELRAALNEICAREEMGVTYEPHPTNPAYTVVRSDRWPPDTQTRLSLVRSYNSWQREFEKREARKARFASLRAR